MAEKVILDGNNLTLEDAERVILEGSPVEASPDAMRMVELSHRALLRLLEEERPVYGVNTGLGKLSSVRVPRQQSEQLQLNLVRSHAVGVGDPLPEEAVRGILLFRINSLLKGYSGVRPELISLLIGMLNLGVHPVIPEQGSVGSSGDLVPLGHLGLVVIGEGEAFHRGERLPGAVALERASLAPLRRLFPKEGLALLNGTAYMLSLIFLSYLLGRRAFSAALGATALDFQALRGHTGPLDERIQGVRPHPGQREVAAALRELLRGSRLTDTYSGDVQDPYSLRCSPQILGAILEAFWMVEERIRVEMNSATDNPLIFPDGVVLSGGNFHGEILALVAEVLGVALSELTASCERRISLLLSATDRGLPPFLAREGGVNSGLMLLQYTAAALAAENKVLAHPAAVDSIPTSGGKEDHNSFGATSAWKLWRIAGNAVKAAALELICSRWAVEFAGPEKLSPATQKLYRRLSELVPPPGGDRYLGEALDSLINSVKKGEIGYGI